MSPHELKALESRLTRAKEELHVRSEAKKNSEREEATAKRKVQYLQEAIRAAKDASPEPVVSEHAILRYLERVRGVDIDAVRREILTQKTVEMIKFSKSGKHLREDATIVFQNSTVVTVEAP